jgi:uncharacterized protein involved in response to NO
MPSSSRRWSRRNRPGMQRTAGMQPERVPVDRAFWNPPLLSGGFRPFFLAGAFWAPAVAGLWLAALSGALTLPTAFDPLAWHRHEMLFGYLGAVIAGFLLTAIPNWTGRLPVSGGPLGGLALLWLAGRLALLFSAWTGPLLALALDAGFPVVLGLVAAREVIAARNRNFPIVVVIFLFAAANALDHAEALGMAVIPGLGWRLGFALVLMLISLIGGRIIPSFTRNWLVKQGETKRLPGQSGPFDKLVLAVSVVALLAWALAPDATPAAWCLVMAGLLQAARLSRWRGLATIRDPLVFVLHIGYGWMPVGLLLLGASALTYAIPQSSALHALAAGAMGTMTLAVMTRATLGHTGGALRADLATVAIYGLVTFGAALRVCAAELPIGYSAALALGGSLWAAAFLLFLLSYGGRLVRPRL